MILACRDTAQNMADIRRFVSHGSGGLLPHMGGVLVSDLGLGACVGRYGARLRDRGTGTCM